MLGKKGRRKHLRNTIMSAIQTADDEPRTPESIPAYVHEGVHRQDPETLRELAAWCEDLADHREAQPIEVGDDEELVDVEESSGSTATTVTKKVPCGKDCGGCPHGPYTYEVHREGDGLVWEYIGPASV